MLDFYLINDEQSKPDYPEKADLKFVSRIDHKTYKTLVSKRIINSRFDYHSDFRWNSQLIEKMYKKIKDKSDSNIEKLSKILNKAMNEKCGLIAYCD